MLRQSSSQTAKAPLLRSSPIYANAIYETLLKTLITSRRCCTPLFRDVILLWSRCSNVLLRVSCVACRDFASHSVIAGTRLKSIPRRFPHFADLINDTRTDSRSTSVFFRDSFISVARARALPRVGSANGWSTLFFSPPLLQPDDSHLARAITFRGRDNFSKRRLLLFFAFSRGSFGRF